MAIQGVPINRQKLLEAIKKHGGCVTKVCKAMNMSTKTFYVYRDQDPEIADAIEEARDQAQIEAELMDEQILEMAVQSLITLIQKLDQAAVIYTMKSLGRKKNPLWGNQVPQVAEPEKTLTLIHQVADDRPINHAVQAEVVSRELHQCDDGGEEASVSSVPPPSG